MGYTDDVYRICCGGSFVLVRSAEVLSHGRELLIISDFFNK